MKHKLLYFLIALFLFACTKEEEPEYELSDSYFRFNRFGLSTSQVETEQDVKISSNRDWELVSHPDWVTITPQSGSGDADIKITISQNTTGLFREGEIVFGAFYSTFKLGVKQQKYPLELVSYTGSESTVIMSEPKYLKFNTPVTLNYIISDSTNISFHVGSDDVEYFDDNRVVKFTGGPSYLGSEHKYKFSVTDMENNRLEKSLKFKFFTQELTAPGEIRKVILDEDNNLWVSSVNYGENPGNGKITQYVQMEDGYEEGIKFAYDLEPTYTTLSGNFFLNPYNDYFYIPDYEGQEILVYSKAGFLVKKINLNPEDSETIYRSSAIGFNNSGMGIMNYSSQWYSGPPEIPWRYIDSANDDLLTKPAYSYKHFHQFVLNHDKSKLFLFADESPIINILGAGEELEEIDLGDIYGNGTVVTNIFQNRLNSKILVTGKNRTQVFTPDLSYKSPQFTYGSSRLDFSYDPNYNSHIYAIRLNSSESYFELLDYETNTPVYSYFMGSYFMYNNGGGLIATPDDKFIITYVKTGKITIYKKEMFE